MSKNTGLIAPGVIITESDCVTHVALSSGAGQAFDVPAGKAIANFSFNGDFWAAYGSTSASVPSTSSTANTTANSELNPTIRNLVSTASCTGISLVSEVAAKGSISWYSR